MNARRFGIVLWEEYTNLAKICKKCGWHKWVDTLLFYPFLSGMLTGEFRREPLVVCQQVLAKMTLCYFFKPRFLAFLLFKCVILLMLLWVIVNLALFSDTSIQMVPLYFGWMGWVFHDCKLSSFQGFVFTWTLEHQKFCILNNVWKILCILYPG